MVKKNGLAQIPLLLVLVVLAVSLPMAMTLVKRNTENRSKAASCDEYCAEGPVTLRSCHPADSDGSSHDSGCLWGGRVESCGSNTTYYCCTDINGVWQKKMTDDCNHNLVLTGVITPTPSVGPTATPTEIQPTTTLTESNLEFTISYPGVMSGAKCASNWPITVTVLAADETKKIFSDVIPERLNESASGGLAKYKVSLDMSGFNQTSDLAVFVKSFKHLQTKYGKNNQTSFYVQSGGKLNITDNNLFDFTGYPVLAGDVNNDDVVNGQDFSQVKTASISRKTVNDGGNISEDLNGNCVMESQDLGLLMITLNQKQDQLY